MKHLEFIGLPGSGKTTLHTLLCNRLEVLLPGCLRAESALSKYMRPHLQWHMRWLSQLLPGSKAEPVFRRSELPKRYLKNFLTAHGMTLEMIEDSPVFKRMTETQQTDGKDRFLEMAAVYQCIAETVPEGITIFFDESLAQRTLPLFLCPDQEQDRLGSVFLHQYMARAPRPAALIYAQAGPEVCLQRMRERERGLPPQLADMTDAAILNYLRLAREHFDQVATWYKRNTRCRVILLPTSGETEAVVNRLQKSLMPFLTGASLHTDT